MKAVRVLMVSFGIIYIWFGMLKFFPGISPAEVLAGETIELLTFGLIKPILGVKLLAVLETVIGLACIIGLFPKITVRLIIAHMICTFTPIFLMPDQIFGEAMLQLTLVGQYILKNLVFVSALLIVYQIVSKREKERTVQLQTATDTANPVQSTAAAAPNEPLIVYKNQLSDS